MVNGSITSKDIVGWIVAIVISLIGSLVPLLIFYLKYRVDKKRSNKKILELEDMLYKQEIELKQQEITLKEEIIARKEEIIARKDLEIKELKNEIQKLKGDNKERNQIK